MAIKKQIEIDVTSNLKEVNAELNKLENNLDDVQKSADKTGKSIDDVAGNGGAIAILDQLTGGLASQFKNAYESTKLFNLSLKGTRSALIATGIGALVVALGAIVAYWDDIVEFINDANKELETQNNLIDINRGLLDQKLGYLEKEKKYNEDNNISNDKLNEKYKNLLSQKASDLKIELENLKILYEKEASLARQQTFWEKLTNKAPKVTEEEAKALAERKTKIVDLQEDLKNTLRAYDELNAVVINVEKSKPENFKPTQKREIGGVVGELTPEGIAEIENAQIVSDAVIQIKKNQLTEEEALDLTRLAFKDEIFQQEADLVIGFGRILQQIGEKNKAFAIAGIIIEQVASAAKAIQSTVVANAKSVAAFPLTLGQPFVTLNTISTGLGIASGALAAKKAISQLGGGGGGSISTPRLSGSRGSAPSPPAFNIVGASGTNQLAEAIGGQSQQPVRAYVVSNDVTTSQSLDRNIVQGATIG